MRALLSILARKNILRTKTHPQSPRVVIKPRGLDGDVVCDLMAGLSGSCLKEDRPPYNEREGGGEGRDGRVRNCGINHSNGNRRDWRCNNHLRGESRFL